MPHTKCDTIAFLAQRDVEVMDWPARSPDMNSIEHVREQMGVWNRHMDDRIRCERIAEYYPPSVGCSSPKRCKYPGGCVLYFPPNGVTQSIHTLRPRQNGRHSQMTFSSAFSGMKMYEFRLNFLWSLFLSIQLKYSNIGSDNGLAPLSEPMMVTLLTHICVTRPQWVNGVVTWC